ncbi:DUF881 domain-containing protein [Marmoricola sp. RAF53]|uniref:DUF881 domain-containing protein n=1 Tax=Marmoricola sp. RAF53 TaxID=3233059 RepID=UPI003F9B6640
MAADETPRPEQPLPDRVTMGLLPYLNAHALDEDYAQAAARRRTGSGRERRRVGRMGAVVVGAFGVLLATAALQTSQNSTSEDNDRQALVQQVTARKKALGSDRDQQAGLRAETRRLQDELLRGSNDSGVVDDLRLLRLKTGVEPVRGPGVEVVVDNAPNAESDRNKVLDTDLQKLVNGLWQSGAEAVSINGERLTALSAIRHAGEAITVNYTSLSRPYRVLAIGDPDTLPARFADTSSGQAWLDLQREVGLRFSMRTRDSLRLPGADVPNLRYANNGEAEPRGKDLS